MTEAVYLDANIFMRIFTGEPESMASDCRMLLAEAEERGLELWVSQMTFAELVWTLRSFYALSRADIAVKLRDLLDHPAVRVDSKEMLRRTVDLYASTNVDFIDAYHALDSGRRGIQRVCSYDHDFDVLPTIRIGPSDLLG